jgi:DNA-binding transcriptional ArsR family regulator
MSPINGNHPLDEAAPLFAALGDETRLELLVRLCADGPHSITRLGSRLPLSRQAITKHLEVLAHAGLVRSARHGRERLWELEPARLGQARQVLERISQKWDATPGRPKECVGQPERVEQQA